MRVIPGFPIPHLPQLPPKHAPKNPNRVGLTIATVNDDFTDEKTNLKRLKNVGVVMVQEAKNTDIRKEFPNALRGAPGQA